MMTNKPGANEQERMEHVQAEFPDKVVLFRFGPSQGDDIGEFRTVGTGAALAQQHLGMTEGRLTESMVAGLVSAGVQVAIAEQVGSRNRIPGV